MSHSLSDQELVRRESFQKLRAIVIEPYPAADYPVCHTTQHTIDVIKDQHSWTQDTTVNV